MKKKQITGKRENEFQYSTLDQIWGDTGMSKYNTLDTEVYKQNLSEMNKSDLQAHACGLGIIPIENREQLIKRLLNAFMKHVATFQRPKVEQKIINPSKEVLSILAEGR